MTWIDPPKAVPWKTWPDPPGVPVPMPYKPLPPTTPYPWPLAQFTSEEVVALRELAKDAIEKRRAVSKREQLEQLARELGAIVTFDVEPAGGAQ